MFNTLQKHNTMKRLFTIGLMLVSAFALTNCAEEITAPVQDDITVDGNIENNTPPEEDVDIPFEVYANVGNEVETKTENRGNNTYWVADDGISVFHKTGNVITHNKEFTISADNLQYGLFKGGLNSQLGETNDWYFIYPYNSEYTYSSSGTTFSGINIGAAEITVSPNSKAHLAGAYSPMYGSLTDHPAYRSPDIKMHHMAAVVAIKVVNEGAGGVIKVKDVEIESKEDIVGSFTFNPSTSKFTGAGTAESKRAKVTLNAPESIAKGGYVTFYMAVKPFTVANNGSLTIKVNGSARTVSIPDEVQLQSGKVTTFKVPVKDYYSIHTYDSDALTLTSKGRLSGDQAETILNISGGTSMTINGKDNVTAYVVGSTSEAGNIIIRGFAKEILDAMPIGFYASQYNDNPTAMTIDYVNVWLPEYTKEGGILGIGGTTNYSKLKERKSLESKFGAITDLLGWDVTENGITRGLITGTLGVDASTITFNKIVSNGYFDASNVVMLDDNPVHKDVSEDKVEAYIKKFGAEATLQGLKDILNAEFSGSTITWTDEAKKTGQAIYDKIKSVVAREVNETLAGTAMSMIGFGDYEALMYQLRDMKFELCIKTYPYAEKYTAAEATGQLQPIVFWGFDANPGE